MISKDEVAGFPRIVDSKEEVSMFKEIVGSKQGVRRIYRSDHIISLSLGFTTIDQEDRSRQRPINQDDRLIMSMNNKYQLMAV